MSYIRPDIENIRKKPSGSNIAYKLFHFKLLNFFKLSLFFQWFLVTNVYANTPFYAVHASFDALKNVYEHCFILRLRSAENLIKRQVFVEQG